LFNGTIVLQNTLSWTRSPEGLTEKDLLALAGDFTGWMALLITHPKVLKEINNNEKLQKLELSSFS